ncbi:5-oxoprolinase subunit B family protein [Amycolatopsis sp. RTGN1]|uniref:5-oxoprolinase subunit B family protein n=1 Tax=Amycolatopsis ponsaeliensis TaxID=2992142 RepID=UPI00255026EB|nr:carboxyltransferase domain-containing protein [Amycolatopsis sp. RTGN1]
MDHGLRIRDAGDSAVMVTASHGDEAHRWETVHALADALETAGIDGVHGLVPTYDTLLVEFDCVRVGHVVVRRAIAQAAGAARSRLAAPARFVVPVVYGGDHGPDLAIVAERLGLSEQDVIDAHSGEDLVVRCLGAPVGAPMMDGPAFGKPVPRLASPRTSVPAGSVAVAGRQAVICPLPSPGGWPLLGRTPLRVLDLGADRLTAYRPGDRFRFVPIDATEWSRYAGRPLEAVDA